MVWFFISAVNTHHVWPLAATKEEEKENEGLPVCGCCCDQPPPRIPPCPRWCPMDDTAVHLPPLHTRRMTLGSPGSHSSALTSRSPCRDCLGCAGYTPTPTPGAPPHIWAGRWRCTSHSGGLLPPLQTGCHLCLTWWMRSPHPHQRDVAHRRGRIQSQWRRRACHEAHFLDPRHELWWLAQKLRCWWDPWPGWLHKEPVGNMWDTLKFFEAFFVQLLLLHHCITKWLYIYNPKLPDPL